MTTLPMAGINGAISKQRRALAPDNPRRLVTLPRLGRGALSPTTPPVANAGNKKPGAGAIPAGPKKGFQNAREPYARGDPPASG
jgi:hypothetical protein